jgi:hypothetical protein
MYDAALYGVGMVKCGECFPPFCSVYMTRLGGALPVLCRAALTRI